jgi:hypothetical protein
MHFFVLGKKNKRCIFVHSHYISRFMNRRIIPQENQRITRSLVVKILSLTSTAFQTTWFLKMTNNTGEERNPVYGFISFLLSFCISLADSACNYPCPFTFRMLFPWVCFPMSLFHFLQLLLRISISYCSSLLVFETTIHQTLSLLSFYLYF